MLALKMLCRRADEHAAPGTKGSLLSMLHACALGRHCTHLCPRRDRLSARGRRPARGHAQVPGPCRGVPPMASSLQQSGSASEAEVHRLCQYLPTAEGQCTCRLHQSATGCLKS